MAATDLSVIIVSYNTQDLLRRTLEELRLATVGINAQVIVVDNASRDASAEMVQQDFPEVELIANRENIGFGRANNQAMHYALGRYVLLLNPDAFVPPDGLRKTVAYMDRNPGCGILGVRLEDSDGTPLPGPRNFLKPWPMFVNRLGLQGVFPGTRLVDDPARGLDVTQGCDWVTGCFYLVRRRLVDEIGLFDPRYFLYCEEVDHCLAARKAGWDVVYFAEVTVVHLGGESARTCGELTPYKQIESYQMESELLYFQKNHGTGTLLLHLVLVTLADGVDMLKQLVRSRPGRSLKGLLRHVGMQWSLFRRTNYGVKPTR